jgi:hypothetical protein
MKTISKVIIIAEGLDLLTTFVGLTFFPILRETNPLIVNGWTTTVLTKIAATVIIVIVVERVGKWPKLIWIVPIIALLPTFWNLLNIALT